MASTIKLKNGSGAPLASDLVQGEPALDLTNKRLYTEDSGGTVIEVGTNPTELQVDNINIDGNAITSTDTDGNIAITPNGTGEVDISKVDIDSGTIDGVTIGGASAGAGTFTNLTATGTTTLAGATTSADISFGDNDKAIFGAGSDLQIYHDGSNSVIKENGTGNLDIYADNLLIRDSAGTEVKAYFDTNGEAALRYDGVTKLATTATGIDVTGTVTADGLTVDTNTLHVDATNNRVGIRTDSPTHDLTVGSTSASDFVIALRGGVGGFLGWDDSANSTILQAPNTRSLSFQVNSDTFSAGTEAMSIASNGDINFYASDGTTKAFHWDAADESLGIGTISPTSLLSVGTLGSTSHARIQVGSSNSTTGSVYFGDGTGASLYAGYVQYSHAEDSLAFGAGSTERMRIDSSGTVQIGPSSSTGSRELRIDTGAGSAVGQDSIINSYRSNADLIIKTNNAEAARFNSSGNLAFPNGQGIDFSASEGGGASASVLDDYEEGTYEPTFTGSTGGSFTPNTSYRTLGYTKIGDMVHVYGRIRLSSSSSPVGSLNISLPFTALSGTQESDLPAGSVAARQVDFPTSTVSINTIVAAGSASANIYATIDNGTWVTLDTSDVASNAMFHFGIFYRAS